MKNLTVLLLYSPTGEVRGKMRRYFYEVRANIFVGVISSSVRDTIWDKIKTENIQASMIFSTNNEQGFQYKTTKTEDTYQFEDFNGIILPTSSDTSLKLWELYAKPDCLLIDHLLDVGCIAEVLMQSGRAHSMVQAISENTGLTTDMLINSISWLCAVHDIGKAHPDFISKMYSNSTDLTDLFNSLLDRKLATEKYNQAFRHERFSRTIVQNFFNAKGYPEEAVCFSGLLAYHHQGKTVNDFSDSIHLDNPEFTNIHQQIFTIINKEWIFDKSLCQHYSNAVLYSILSIMVTADWIASGSQWRTLLHKIGDRRGCAQEFIKLNQLSYIPMSARFSNIHWKDIFDFAPNNLQQSILTITDTKQDLMIVEYPCGGGKTEAALAAALKIGGSKSGIYIATPTMSTAKGMASRMNQLAKKAKLDLNIPEFDSSALWSEDDMLKIPPELWVSRSRHKMLYPFAVGTVDQILKTILYARYSCIGLMGLSDKVLIIDEVHAYDSYMLTELKTLLRWANFLKIPIILLSATLPTITKNELLQAYGCTEAELPTSTEYPLITTFNKDICQSFPVACEGKTFKLNIIKSDNPIETWNDLLSKQYPGCTAYIESTVDKTWQLFDIANQYDKNAIMFNGRDTLAHKEKKTDMLLKALGKSRDMRPEHLTLTATSIIEQSLDIDLDRMITNIAPIDLLIQRFGRVWRHSDVGTVREKEPIDTPITIIIPSKLPTFIYDSQILKNTISILDELTEINTVSDARRLIDAVYNSKELINNFAQNVRAGQAVISDPLNDEMLDTRNSCYEKFYSLMTATRDTTYPTVQIGFIDESQVLADDIKYEIVRNIIFNNVVTVATTKLKLLADVERLPVLNKELSDVYLYDKATLLSLGICLTEDGLRWDDSL